jgi:hypothetical protein
VGLVFPTRGSAVAARLTHAQEVAGSIPAPAIEPSAATVRASVERGDPFAARVFPAMLGGSLTSEPEGWSTAAGRPAGADEAVADDAHRPDAQLGVVAADTDGDDPASVEHGPQLTTAESNGARARKRRLAEERRQARLSRWQRLPT